MTETVKSQILQIRDSAKTNMLDIPMVQRVAFDMGLYELVDYLIDGKKEYWHFIMTGKADEEE